MVAYFQLQPAESDLQQLADQYWNETGEREHQLEAAAYEAGEAIRSGEFNLPNLETIVRWKSERVVHYLIGNSNESIKAALATVVAPESTTETALQALIDGGTIPNPPKRVPREVAHWRIALVLDQAGRLAQVESLIAGLPQPQYSVASAAWAGMSAIARRSPLVLAVAAALGYSDAEMDALFIAADSISA